MAHPAHLHPPLSPDISVWANCSLVVSVMEGDTHTHTAHTVAARVDFPPFPERERVVVAWQAAHLRLIHLVGFPFCFWTTLISPGLVC